MPKKKIPVGDWDSVIPFEEYVETKTDLVSLVISGRETTETYQEYELWAYGKIYRTGDKTEKIVEMRRKKSIRQYTKNVTL